MLKITTGLAAAALLLVTVSAQAGEQKKSKSVQVGTTQTITKVTVAKPARVPDYLDVAGFKGSPDDPLYSYAAIRTVPAPKPVISSFPLPYAVYW